MTHGCWGEFFVHVDGLMIFKLSQVTHTHTHSICINHYPECTACSFEKKALFWTSFCSGTAIMQDGNTMRNNYGCDLDSLTTGSRIGMMRTASGDLHYFINGVDQGLACTGLPPGNSQRRQFTCLYPALVLSSTIIIKSLHLAWF